MIDWDLVFPDRILFLTQLQYHYSFIMKFINSIPRLIWCNCLFPFESIPCQLFHYYKKPASHIIDYLRKIFNLDLPLPEYFTLKNDHRSDCIICLFCSVLILPVSLFKISHVTISVSYHLSSSHFFQILTHSYFLCCWALLFYS